MHGIMLSGQYPCVRAGKITRALAPWKHSCVSRGIPPQFRESYDAVHAIRFATRSQLGERIASIPHDIVHVHNEPNWAVSLAREYTDKPIIYNVHDVTSARPMHPLDPTEEQSYKDCDAFVFITEEQRQFAISCGFEVEGKPYALLGNYADDCFLIDKTPMPRIGGVCYAGGLDARDSQTAWRDLSPIADALKGQLHIYPGNPNVDYGIVNPTIFEYEMMPYHLARHDWGFTGTAMPIPAWSHSLPNKAFEYLASGVPIIALNNPLLKPLCDEGLGVYLDDIKDIKRLPDPRPYKKRVMAQRHRFTMGYNIEPVRELYKQLLGGTK